MTPGPMSICDTCGSPYERTDNHARCHDCQPVRQRRPSRTLYRRASAKELGYDWTWRKLSRRARRLQPFCSDCGSTEDLTGDHSPRAWERKSKGLVIRLQDIDVTCRGCNSLRGPARGPEARERPDSSLYGLRDLSEG